MNVCVSEFAVRLIDALPFVPKQPTHRRVQKLRKIIRAPNDLISAYSLNCSEHFLWRSRAVPSLEVVSFMAAMPRRALLFSVPLYAVRWICDDTFDGTKGRHDLAAITEKERAISNDFFALVGEITHAASPSGVPAWLPQKSHLPLSLISPGCRLSLRWKSSNLRMSGKSRSISSANQAGLRLCSVFGSL